VKHTFSSLEGQEIDTKELLLNKEKYGFLILGGQIEVGSDDDQPQEEEVASLESTSDDKSVTRPRSRAIHRYDTQDSILYQFYPQVII
jgi:hypothetical protein